MRIKNLSINNIGPFKNASLDFISSEEELKSPPVIFITGENGTGKSIIIDSIRALLKGRFGGIERDITSSETFSINSNIFLNGKDININSNSKYQKDNNSIDTNNMNFNKLFVPSLETDFTKNFVFDYWTSKLSNDNFNISNISAISADNYLGEALNGIHKNIDITKVISFFDYLKDSKNKDEKILGKSLYNILEQIINLSITNGELSHVSRINLKPIIKIGDSEKLSSGNLYLIQRLSSILSQVYSICTINNILISNYQEIEGILLIDEAENHLHPKWQKTFLNNILKLFPKLQIIVTTHSPFIVSSIKNSKVYVCKSQIKHSVIEEETDFYSNKPVEEVLMSPLFNTSNFNIEISDLITKRKIAQNNKNSDEVERIESLLKEQNPEYFNYLNLEKIIKSIKK